MYITDEQIIRYINHECSLEEAKVVLLWIEANEENKEHFKKVVLAWSVTDWYVPESRKHGKKFYLAAWSAVVAVVLLLVGVGIYRLFPSDNTIERYQALVGDAATEKNILLKVDKDQTVVLRDSSVFISYSPKGVITVNDTMIIANKHASAELNSITVPYGRRSRLVLPDGTLVYLNSGSSLVYPSHFDRDQREVFLAGEAFFIVAKEKNGRRFLVKTQYRNIEVKGTKFNVQADKNEKLFEAVLVSGAITLDGEHGPVDMRPNQYYRFSAVSRKEEIKDVDVSNYISWINGKIKFYREPLEKILYKLEKTYNVNIRLDDPSLGRIFVSGSLDLNNPLDDIIQSLLMSLSGEENTTSYTISKK